MSDKEDHPEEEEKQGEPGSVPQDPTYSGPERRRGKDRRSGEDRRKALGKGYHGSERRTGKERRSGKDRRRPS